MRIATSTIDRPNEYLRDLDPDVVKYPHNCCFLSGWLGSKTWMFALNANGGTVLWSNSFTVEMHWRVFSPPILRPGSFSSLTRISTKAICRFILGSTLFMVDGYFSSTGTYTKVCHYCHAQKFLVCTSIPLNRKALYLQEDFKQVSLTGKSWTYS